MAIVLFGFQPEANYMGIFFLVWISITFGHRTTHMKKRLNAMAELMERYEKAAGKKPAAKL